MPSVGRVDGLTGRTTRRIVALCTHLPRHATCMIRACPYATVYLDSWSTSGGSDRPSSIIVRHLPREVFRSVKARVGGHVVQPSWFERLGFTVTYFINLLQLFQTVDKGMSLSDTGLSSLY